jgi:hypothetical protein
MSVMDMALPTQMIKKNVPKPSILSASTKGSTTTKSVPNMKDNEAVE